MSPAPPSGRGGRRPGSGRPPRSTSTPPDRPGADSPLASSSASRRPGSRSGTRAAGVSPLVRVVSRDEHERLEKDLEQARRDVDTARWNRTSRERDLAKAQKLIAELEAENGALRRENRELSSVVGKYEQRELAREKAESRAGRARERQAAAEQMAVAAVEREAEQLAEELEERDAQLAEAKAELEEAQGAAEAAAAEAQAVKYQKMLSDRKLQRARDRLDKADTRAVRKCSVEEFAQLSRTAQSTENWRDRKLWREFLPEGRRLEPLIDVLDGQGRLGELFKLAKVQSLHLTGLAFPRCGAPPVLLAARPSASRDLSIGLSRCGSADRQSSSRRAPHLPISPHVSPCLPMSPHVSPCLPMSRARRPRSRRSALQAASSEAAAAAARA